MNGINGCITLRNTSTEIATPRTDAEEECCSADPSSAYMQMRDFARKLERELSEVEGYPGIVADFEYVKTCLREAATVCAGVINANTTESWKIASNRPNPRVWECGCGHINGVNLAFCAQCGRRPNEGV